MKSNPNAKAKFLKSTQFANETKNKVDAAEENHDSDDDDESLAPRGVLPVNHIRSGVRFSA